MHRFYDLPNRPVHPSWCADVLCDAFGGDLIHEAVADLVAPSMDAAGYVELSKMQYDEAWPGGGQVQYPPLLRVRVDREDSEGPAGEVHFAARDSLRLASALITAWSDEPGLSESSELRELEVLVRALLSGGASGDLDSAAEVVDTEETP